MSITFATRDTVINISVALTFGNENEFLKGGGGSTSMCLRTRPEGGVLLRSHGGAVEHDMGHTQTWRCSRPGEGAAK